MATVTAQRPYPFWLGGAAASMAACVTHPLDVMRVRLQTSAGDTSLVNAVKITVQKAGIQGLYPGLTASIFRQLTYSVTRFGAYDAMKNMMSNNGTKKLSTGQMVVCASVAGALGGVAGNPADIILVRMTADATKPREQRLGYKNAADGLFRMIREEGVSSVGRGIVPNTIRAILMNASQLVSYDFFKDAILTKGYMTEGMPLHFVASAMAGTVATTICAPADVVKSRVMNTSSGVGPIQMLAQSFKAEGPRFLFKGWLPAWIRLTPNSICIFIFLEQLRKAVDTVRG